MVRCSRIVYKAVLELGQTFRKHRDKYIEDTGVFLIEGIKNNKFKVETNTWLYNKRQKVFIYKHGLWRHAVAIVDGNFIVVTIAIDI